MMQWTLEELDVPLKFEWNISRGSKKSASIFYVTVKEDDISGTGEIAFNPRYGESREVIQNNFKQFVSDQSELFESIEELIGFLKDGEYCRSFRFGIESAFVHMLAKLVQKRPCQLLSMPERNQLYTSFSIPIMEPGKIRDFIERFELTRFKSLKMKLNSDFEMMKEAVKQVTDNYGGNLRLDANEAFSDPDDVIKFLEDLGDNCPIEFLEQPFSSDCHDEYKYLKDLSPVDIFADESLQDGMVTSYHEERFHGVNIKLMKAGGYFNAIRQLRAAKDLGLKTMLGCMVETSLGISSALNVAAGFDYYDLDGCLFLQRDPLNLIAEEKGKIFLSRFQ